MKTGKLLFATISMWIFSLLFGWLTCGWLFHWVYELPPIIWKDPAIVTSSCNMLWVSLIGLVGWFLFATVYAILYDGIPKMGIKKGMIYGILAWFIGPLIGIAVMPFYMTIAVTVVVYWLIQSFIVHLINGAILGLLYKK